MPADERYINLFSESSASPHRYFTVQMRWNNFNAATPAGLFGDLGEILVGSRGMLIRTMVIKYVGTVGALVGGFLGSGRGTVVDFGPYIVTDGSAYDGTLVEEVKNIAINTQSVIGSSTFIQWNCSGYAATDDLMVFIAGEVW